MNNSSLKKCLQGLRYSFHVIVRPFDGFYDLKHEKRGNVLSATVIFIATVLTWLFNRQYAGYFFLSYDKLSYNILTEIATIVLPFFLWLFANWCLTTLMDGEGNMKDIYIATAYSLVPLILILIPLTVISNFLSLEEAAYYFFFYAFSFVWLFYLLFIGTMVTHQYLIKKTILTCILTILGMLIIIFIGLLFYSVIQKIIFFVVNSYNELSFRFN